MKPKTLILIIGATLVVLLFVFCGRTILADEPIMLNTKSHQVTTPTTIDFGTATLLGLPLAINGLPTGGTAGQLLQKKSATNYDTQWITLNITNWDTAYADRMKWDGGLTGLNPTTGRASLGLGTAALNNTGDFEVPLTFSQSVRRATNTITLQGDAATPGNSRYYGTDNTGAKGYFALPTFSAPVTSVFTRTGAITAQSGDYSAFYEALLGNPAANGYILSSTTGGARSWIAPASAPVSSVFTRTGAIAAQSGDYASFYAPLAAAVPTGGGPGQVLTKNTSTNYDTVWSSPSGTGTVTSFSAGNLSPLFTTTVSTATTTPALSFTLSNALGNQFFGFAGAPSGSPTFRQVNFNNLAGFATTTQGGVPTGGTTNQVLTKNGATDYDTSWTTPTNGTVTSVNSTSLAPLFTTSVSNATTTPQINYTAPTVAAGTVYANNSASVGVPGFVANPRITAIANLTGNGFVKTGGGLGTLSVDTASYLTGNQTITLSGDATGSGTTSIPVTVTSVNGITYPATGALNTVPLVTSANTTATYTATTGTGNIVRSASPTFTGTAIFATINPTTIGGSTTAQAPFNINGVTDGSAAAAGNVGQVVTAARSTAAGLSQAANATSNVTSISLTAGDWDVRGSVGWYLSGVPTANYLGGGFISTTSLGSTDDGYQGYAMFPVQGGLAYATAGLASRRISLTSTTTIYLVSVAPGFASGTCKAFGFIEARRIR